MSKKPETTARPTKKGTRTTKADELVQGSSAELNEEDLKRVSGGGVAYKIK
jgi:hypothetical protein